MENELTKEMIRKARKLNKKYAIKPIKIKGKKYLVWDKEKGYYGGQEVWKKLSKKEKEKIIQSKYPSGFIYRYKIEGI